VGRRLWCQAINGKFLKKDSRASTLKVSVFNQLIFIGMTTWIYNGDLAAILTA
jgi:hypothetical protein